MGTWHGDPDDAAARFLAEHGGVSRVDGDEHVIEFGNGALLPPWPPEVKETAGSFVSSADNESPLVASSSEPNSNGMETCGVCATPVSSTVTPAGATNWATGSVGVAKFPGLRGSLRSGRIGHRIPTDRATPARNVQPEGVSVEPSSAREGAAVTPRK